MYYRGTKPFFMSYLLAVDIGTTLVKGLAFTPAGQTIAIHKQQLQLLSDHPTHQELEPEAVLSAVINCIQAIQTALQTPPEALVFSCFMHSLMAVDQQGNPLSRIITWADGRSQAQADQLLQSGLGKKFYHLSGTAIHPMSPLCKLAWWRQSSPDSYQSIHKYVSAKSYILFQLTGQWVEDYSVASASGLFDHRKLTWSQEILAWLDIKTHQLPEAVETGTILQPKSGAYLSSKTKVIPGANDGCLANLGAQAWNEGDLVITIGTSAAIRRFSDGPREDPVSMPFNYLLEKGVYVNGGASNNGGIVAAWWRDFSDGPNHWQEMEAAAGRLSPGSDGLLALPYLMGERSPVWSANARGAILGWSKEQGPGHFYRASLEAVGFNLLQIAGIWSTETIKRIIATGGFTVSKLWVQTIADQFGVPVTIRSGEETGAIGAAMMAGKSLGWWTDYRDTPLSSAELTQIFQPNEDHHAIYREYFSVYKRLYPILRQEMENLNVIRQSLRS